MLKYLTLCNFSNKERSLSHVLHYDRTWLAFEKTRKISFALWYRFSTRQTINWNTLFLYTVIKHGFLTNQNVCRALSILQCCIFYAQNWNLCATLTLINVGNNVNETSKTFPKNKFGFIGFSKQPTEWRLSNGSQVCACYASNNITNDRHAWLREGFINIRDVNVFISCTFVSLKIPGLEKSLSWKLRALSTAVAWSKSILWTNWFARCPTLELLSPTQTALLCSFNLVSKALSVCP